jgi:hypothetical protein
MVLPRVVELLTIGDQGTKQCAQFNQSMPVTAIARKARGVQAEHKSDPTPTQTKLCNDLLEPQPVIRRFFALAQIFVNDANRFAGPAKRNGPVHQPVLHFGAFGMMRDLTQG